MVAIDFKLDYPLTTITVLKLKIDDFVLNFVRLNNANRAKHRFKIFGCAAFSL